jgi:hypothetical protein
MSRTSRRGPRHAAGAVAYGCPKTELESGTLLAELEQRFAYGLDDVARRFDRSVSRVSR